MERTYFDCEALLNSAKLPLKVIEHCRAVAELSYKIAVIMNGKGCRLDPELCRRAGLLHDICRIEKDHDVRAYELLIREGYLREAEITLSHMGKYISADNISEKEIVYLADKLIMGTSVVTLNQRFETALEKYGRDSEAEREIQKKYALALSVKQSFDKILENDLYKVIRGIN
ncbi:MAG: HD domain-containing protein [Papillibacter sp.]|nr:HD domain-containing protein [Papillibacter sp.]